MTQPRASEFSRRRFLRTLGVSAAAVPLVIGLASLYSKAAAPPKKRFVFMYTPYAQYYYNWRLRLPAVDADISDGSALASPNLILHPLQPNAKQLLILDRLSFIGARSQFQNALNSPDHLDHPGTTQQALANLLTGRTLIGGDGSLGNPGLGNGISLDQVLATQLFANQVLPSLEVGVQVNENITDRYADKRISYDGPSSPRRPENDPFALFSRVFGKQLGTTKPTYRQFVDRSSLDAVLADFARLKGRLSAADYQLLQAHADAVRALELRLGTVAQCLPPDLSQSALGVTPTDSTATHKWAMTAANFAVVGDIMTDIIVQALACGLTNVVTWMWKNAENDDNYSAWIPNLNPNLGAHGMAHARDPGLISIGQWYASRFKVFIDKLAAIPDSGAAGSLLDNSLVVWGSDLSDPVPPNNVPLVLAGSNGGYFRTGRSLRFDDVWTPSQWSGPVLGPSDSSATTTALDLVRSGDQLTVGPNDRSNSDLCVSILNSFGIETDTFGDPRFCKGPLPMIRA
jgi:hypothetical protein